MLATKAAANTFVRVFSDPEGEERSEQFQARVGYYRYLWHWYQNSIFDDLATWARYKSRYRLYRHIRAIYNPARRLVDFYAGVVYPGMLATDPEQVPPGVSLAIPLPADTPPELLAALGELWRWSNWQLRKSLFVRYGAALGNVFVEVVDELDRGKVTLDVLWPGLVSDLTLDSTGNVKAYALEYTATDENGNAYTYRKEVDANAIRTFRDGLPYSYDDVPAERENPYGFAPAVWCPHTDLGGDHGAPAMRNLGKWDELNSLAAHVFDQAHRILETPVLVAGDGVSHLATDQSKRGATHRLSNPESDRESVQILKAGPGGQISTITLPEGEAQARLDSLLREIEQDHPEIGMYQQLREMQQVTGPGAERLFGDVRTYVDDARANYDSQSVKLFQMAIAIAGWRANSGAWGRELTDQQRAFLPFDLTSYARGDLELTILPRPLVPLTPSESMALEEQRLALEMQQQLALGEGLTVDGG